MNGKFRFRTSRYFELTNPAPLEPLVSIQFWSSMWVCEFLFLTYEKIENERDFVSRIVEMILLKCIPQVQIEISNCLKDKVRTNKA